jgi:hypothetical protein
MACSNAKRPPGCIHNEQQLQHVQEVCYFCGASSVPGVLLYWTEQFAFVQFETRHWPGYRGFSNFVTAAIFAEHLKPDEQGLSSPKISRPEFSRVLRE